MPFDLDTMDVVGDPVTLTEEAVAVAREGGAEFALSMSGTLVYVPARSEGNRTLVWVDREGREEALGAPALRYVYPRISPDGTRVAVDIRRGGNRDIYIWDFERENMTRLTDHPTEDLFAVWSRDAQRIFFSSDRNGVFNVFSRAADGAGPAELILESPRVHMLTSLTPDGSRLVIAEEASGTGGDRFDIVALTVGEPRTIEPVLATTYREIGGEVSPNGNWLAYQSDETGQVEVWLRPFPDVNRQRIKISVTGGEQPLWGPDGNELFYRNLAGDMMAVPVQFLPDFTHGAVTEAFPKRVYPSSTSGSRRYDISPIDGRILIRKPVEDSSGAAENLAVVLNWLEEVKERVPVP